MSTSITKDFQAFQNLNEYEQTLFNLCRDVGKDNPAYIAQRDIGDTLYACKKFAEVHLKGFTPADIIAVARLVLAREASIIKAAEKDV
jgi:hypothetical protein